jgi:hypothetical protein
VGERLEVAVAVAAAEAEVDRLLGHLVLMAVAARLLAGGREAQRQE